MGIDLSEKKVKDSIKKQIERRTVEGSEEDFIKIVGGRVFFDDNSFILAPAPSADFTFELHYLYRPTSITASSDGTSWIGTNAPDALLYGSLVEAATFLKLNLEELQMFEARFVAAVNGVKGMLEEGINNKDEYRYASAIGTVPREQ